VDTQPGKDKWHILPWKLHDIKDVMNGWQNELQGRGWNSLYLENHDQPRSVSRFGDDKQYRVESAKMLATWLHMMQGTTYIYQGQEIGMTNAAFEDINDWKDVETRNAYRDLVGTKKFTLDQMMKAIHQKSRDNARTPVQWNDTENAGFTKGTPWIKVNPNYKEINVAKDQEDTNSVFNYYRKLVQIRKTFPVVVYGSFTSIMDDSEEIYSYLRTFYNDSLLVITNFSKNPSRFQLDVPVAYSEYKLLISNYPVDEQQHFEKITLRPYEARVYLLNAQPQTQQ